MEDKEHKISDSNRPNHNSETVAKIVSNVIDEYDVIEDSDESSNRKNEIPEQSGSDQTKSSAIPVPDQTFDKQTSNNNEISNRNRLSSSDRSNTVTEDQVYLINYPRTNCAEKIIICLDASAEMDKLTFRSRAGDKSSPKQLAKRGLNIFLQSKQKLGKKHEYALVLLQETATWVRDFTSNPRDIQVALEDIVDTHFCDTCDVSSVFDKITEKVDIPRVPADPTCFPPPYIVRVIFIYGRSNCPLEFTKKESFNMLNTSPYFFLDAVYLHEPPSDENQCQTVFNTLCDLDQKGLAYILRACRNPTKLFDGMAQLLAHPLQRPQQDHTSYRIGSSIPENG